jgi:Ca-activated chloride channel homolog
LTLLVDVSGSMGDSTKHHFEDRHSLLTLVQEGLFSLSDNFIDGDVVNLITFSREANVLIEALTIEDNSSSHIIFSDAVDSMTQGGGTNLNTGIEKAYEVALNTYDSNKQNRVIILTDAHANSGEVDPQIIAKHTKINNQEGIYFSGLGIGESFNESFLNELTEAGKGAYFSILSLADVKRAFDTKLQALLNVAARDVAFSITYPSAFNHAYSASEEFSSQEDEVQKSNFSYNTKQYFYEAFIANDANSTLDEQNITLTINYEDPITYEKKRWNTLKV